MRPVVAYFRARGFKIMPYMDNFGSLAATPHRLSPVSQEQATAGRVDAIAVFRNLEIKIHKTKGATVSTRTLDLLGFTIDTCRCLLLPSPDRLRGVVGSAVSLRRHATTHRRWVTLHALQRLCGAAVSTFPAVPDACFRLQALYACSPSGPLRGMRQLPARALADLEWWCSLATSPDVGCAPWQQPVRGELTTDACENGWGGLHGRLVPARGFFSADDQAAHVIVKEMRAMLYTLQVFPNLRGPGVVRLRLDSMVSVHVLNSMRSRSPALMTVVRALHAELHRRQLRAEGYWLSTVANAHADRLSRDRDSSNWRLRRSVFSVLHARSGPFTIDRFATSLNTHLPRFNSAVAYPNSEAVDAYRQRWGGAEHNNINPPLSQAALAIAKVAAGGASAVLVLPFWPAQPWWARINHLAQAAVLLPDGAPLFTHNRYTGPGHSPRWQAAAFYVGTPTTQSTDLAGGRSPTWETWPPSARQAPAIRLQDLISARTSIPGRRTRTGAVGRHLGPFAPTTVGTPFPPPLAPWPATLARLPSAIWSRALSEAT